MGAPGHTTGHTTGHPAGHTLQAARWVIRIGRLQWGLLVAYALWSLVVMAATLSPVALVVAAAVALLATLWGTVVRAFERHRRWAWWVLLGVSVPSLLLALLSPEPGLLGVVGNVAALVQVLLLLHPDSREWVAPDPVDPPSAPASGRWPGALPGG